MRAVAVTGRPSERLVRSLALFGLVCGPGEGAGPPNADARDVARVLGLPGGSIALCAGPSGCGKSVLVRAVAEAARARGDAVLDARELLAQAEARPVIDLLDVPLATALHHLAASGLAEPLLWARRPGELSEGQRARLGLALAMARVPRDRRALLVLDEFCSGLDRVAARGVSRTLRRWVSGRARLVAVCASAHEDLAAWLRPDALVRVDRKAGAA